MSTERIHEIDDVRVWLDESGGIAITAVSSSGDPVELSSTREHRISWRNRLAGGHLRPLSHPSVRPTV